MKSRCRLAPRCAAHLDARAAALAANTAWNHANFSFYTVITNYATNAQGTGFSYTGIAQLGGKASHLLRNFISVRTASHEYGHNLGLNHSEYWLTDSPSPIGEDSKPGGYAGDAADNERIEYGHRFAVMSGQDGPGDLDSGRAHYAASDKNRLDWLAAGAGDMVSTTTSGTYQLHRHDVRSADFAAMTGGVARALKINLPATDPTGFAEPYKYWLNYRLLPTNGIAENWLPHGLQVDWRRDGSGFRAVQLDITPYSRDSGPYGSPPGPNGDNDDKDDAVLLVGRTFSDTGANIHFTPVAKGGSNPNEWLDVVVNIGTQGTNAPPQIQNFTVSNATPGTGQTVNFAVTATDPNGDTLAYHWDMDDNTVQSGQLNTATRAKLWSSAGYYVVRVEVSDMKGGKTTASAVIRVGTPTNTGMIRGRATHAGRPVEGVFIRGGGMDAWTGGGGTVAMVTPYRIELPLGFAAQFTTQAFDGSGNPVAFNPTWSVSGGGVIGSNGVFEAQSLGGPFVVTAQSGAVTATAEVTVVAAGNVGAASGTWLNTLGGSWNTATNWTGGPPGVIAGGPGYTADFSTLNLTADTTVNLDGARPIGNLIFGDTNTNSIGGWTLATGSGGLLTLAGATPLITVNPLGSGKFASITAQLNGFNGFTKTGTGNLILNNANNAISGAVVLSGGNIQLNSASLSNTSTVLINAGSLVVATSTANAIGGTISFGGGTLQYNVNPGTDYSARFSTAANQHYRISLTSGRETTFSSNLASAGGSLTKLNNGTLILASANNYTGGTTLSAGTLNFGNAGALGGGPISFTGNATLQAGVAADLPNAVSIATGVTGTLDTNANNTTLGGTLTGSGNLTKTGDGILNISGGGSSNTLSGTINVNVGTLAINSVNPAPGIQSFANMNGAVTVTSGACFNFTQNFTAENLDNNITLSGSGTAGLGALNLWRNATANGTITLAADATISHTFNTATISGSITGTDRNLTLTTLNANQPGMTVSGPIQLGTGGITVTGVANSGTFSIRLSGNNSYSGETRVVTGTLMLSGGARLNDSSTVRIGSGAVLHLDFTNTGWATGYFGKWHHGEQAERPGFSTQRSFRGQGHYYNATFYDENGTAAVSNKWVDEQSTDYLIDFINTQHSAGEPFLAFLGLKTPHGPRQDGNGVSAAPAGFDTLFTGTDPVAVPNLLSQGASPPPWKPDANTAGLGNDPRNYMRLISAADAGVGRILDRLTTLEILDNTVVIFLSDKGYFLGEHGLGDKRAAYEESLRIPFTIRYPALQAGGNGRIANELALQVDLAPTILDLAGLPVPAEMQGRSLRPLIENQTPPDWRDSFFFSYTDDPEFAGSTADFIGVRLQDGRKLVRYGLDSSWDEFYKTSTTGPGSDQYELSNLVSTPSEATEVATLQTRLEQATRDLGFLQQIDVQGGDPMTMEVQAGATYPFVLKTSTDLNNWTTASTFEGSGETLAIDLVSGTPASWDVSVDGDAADHVLIGNSTVTASNGTSILACGANAGVGRNAVLVFALPPLPAGQKLKLAQLEIVAKRNFAKWWEADLWALGIKGNTSPILEYHGTPSDPAPPGLWKLQDAIFDVSLPNVATTVRSSLASGLSADLRSAYQSNPGYTGGQYLFLRINPEKLDMSNDGSESYDVFAAGNSNGQAGPKLQLSFQSQTSEPKRFWRVGYGID